MPYLPLASLPSHARAGPLVNRDADTRIGPTFGGPPEPSELAPQLGERASGCATSGPPTEALREHLPFASFVRVRRSLQRLPRAACSGRLRLTPARRGRQG